MLSVICPIYNEEKYISDCIESILQQDYPKDDLEVLFVDGMSSDNTRNIVKQYVEKHSFIRLLDNPQRIVPPALNIAIRESKGDVVMRLDAHAKYPNNYFSVLVTKLHELKADNVGGICLTLPVNETPTCQAIAAALSSPFGMGNSYFRIGTDKEMEVDTVPFGCFKRDIFDRIGYFDEELIRNQDDEFNGRIVKNGGKIFLIPDVVVEYYARDTIVKISKMFYQYGLFKPLVNKKLKGPASVRQLFPFLFVLGLICGFGLSFVHPIIAIIYAATIFAYLVLATIYAIKNFHDIKRIAILIATFFVIHVSYGWGYLRGILKLLLKRDFVAKVNR